MRIDVVKKNIKKIPAISIVFVCIILLFACNKEVHKETETYVKESNEIIEEEFQKKLVIEKRNVEGPINTAIYNLLAGEEKYYDNLFKAETQYSMNNISQSIYNLWNNGLNNFIKIYYENIKDIKEKEAFNKERISWLKEKDDIIIRAREEYEDGSMSQVESNLKGAEFLKKKTIDLAKRLASKINEKISKTPNLYDLYFIKEKEKDIYDSLGIRVNDDGTYDIVINIYGLMSFKGKGEIDSNKLHYKDNDIDVEADIYIDGDNAKVVIEKSNLDYINVGTEFYFDEKD